MQPTASVAVPASVSLNLAGSRPRTTYRRKKYGRTRSYGRSYARGTRTSYYQKRAALRKAYLRGRYPSSTYAHPYVARGSAAAQALGITAGQTFAESNPQEQALRRSVGWYGRGAYMQGRGGYIGATLGGLAGGALGLAAISAPLFTRGALKPMRGDVAMGLYRAGAAAGSQAEDWIRNRALYIFRYSLIDSI